MNTFAVEELKRIFFSMTLEEREYCYQYIRSLHFNDLTPLEKIIVMFTTWESWDRFREQQPCLEPIYALHDEGFLPYKILELIDDETKEKLLETKATFDELFK